MAVAEAPVQICQVHEEFEPLMEIYRTVKPRRVLELGTASGGTLYHWLKDAQPGTLVVTVDLHVSDYEAPSQELIDEWSPEGVRCAFVKGNTHRDDTIKYVDQYGPYDWLFIDAAHDYDAVRMDWEMYMPMVIPTGFVVLHDIALVRAYDDGSPPAGVWRLWREIQMSGYWTREFRTAVDEYGIGVVRIP